MTKIYLLFIEILGGSLFKNRWCNDRVIPGYHFLISTKSTSVLTISLSICFGALDFYFAENSHFKIFILEIVSIYIQFI